MIRIREITSTRVHYGHRRVHVLLRREGHPDNVERVYRLYRDEGLSLRLKRPKGNKAAKLRQPKQWAHTINEIWGMDFVADNLFDGRKLGVLGRMRPSGMPAVLPSTARRVDAASYRALNPAVERMSDLHQQQMQHARQ